MAKRRRVASERQFTAFSVVEIGARYKRRIREGILRTIAKDFRAGLYGSVETKTSAARSAIAEALQRTAQDFKTEVDNALPDFSPLWVPLPHECPQLLKTLTDLVLMKERDCIEPMELLRWQCDVVALAISGQSFEAMVKADRHSSEWGDLRYGFGIEGEPLYGVKHDDAFDPEATLPGEPKRGQRIDLSLPQAALLLEQLKEELIGCFYERGMFLASKFRHAQLQVTGRIAVRGSTLGGVVQKIVAEDGEVKNRCVEMRQLDGLCIPLTGRRAIDVLARRSDIRSMEVTPAYIRPHAAAIETAKQASPVTRGAIWSFPYEDMAAVIRDKVLNQKAERVDIVGMDLSDVVTSGALYAVLNTPGIEEVRILSFNPDSDLIPQVCQGYSMSAEDMRDKLNENLRLLRRLVKQVKPEKLEVRLTRGLVLRAVFVDIKNDEKTSFAIFGNPNAPAHKGVWIGARNDEEGLMRHLHKETKGLWEAAVSIAVTDVMTTSDGI